MSECRSARSPARNLGGRSFDRRKIVDLLNHFSTFLVLIYHATSVSIYIVFETGRSLDLLSIFRCLQQMYWNNVAARKFYYRTAIPPNDLKFHQVLGVGKFRRLSVGYSLAVGSDGNIHQCQLGALNGMGVNGSVGHSAGCSVRGCRSK